MGKAKKAGSGKKGKKGKKGSAGGQDGTPSKQSADSKKQAGGSGENAASASSSGAQSGSGTPSAAGPPAPPMRPMLPLLVLPSDLTPELQRRTSIRYVYDWNNVWFFPVGCLAIVIIVAGMICLWAVMVDRDARRIDDNATSVRTTESNSSAETTRQRLSVLELHAPGKAYEPGLGPEGIETTDAKEDVSASSSPGNWPGESRSTAALGPSPTRITAGVTTSTSGRTKNETSARPRKSSPMNTTQSETKGVTISASRSQKTSNLPDSSTVTPGGRVKPDVTQELSIERVSAGNSSGPSELSAGA